MTHPLVVHCRQSRYDIYIGRPSKWGNPWKVGWDGDRQEVIERYRYYILHQAVGLQAQLQELRGKTLGCWCAPLPCHGDVLAHLANPAGTCACGREYTGLELHFYGPTCEACEQADHERLQADRQEPAILDRSLDPRCPACGYALRLRADQDGQRLACPSCGASLKARLTEFRVNDETHVHFEVEPQ